MLRDKIEGLQVPADAVTAAQGANGGGGAGCAGAGLG